MYRSSGDPGAWTNKIIVYLYQMLWESKKTGGDIQDVYKQEFHISFGFFACGKGRVGGEGFVTLLCRISIGTNDRKLSM